MKRILIPTNGPCQWRNLLGNPEKHWKRTRSAFELAVSWERAQRFKDRRGLPCEVAAALETESALKQADLIFALPEHKVTLNTSKAPSQTDLWALLRNEKGLVSLGVEAKAGEPFDETVADWLYENENTKSRKARLQWLCQKLSVNDSTDKWGSLRYQLFHRTVSALKEAERCGAFAAVMMVQAFPGAERSWRDFQQFGEHLGVAIKRECMARVPSHHTPQLYLGWVSCACATDAEVAEILINR